MVLFPLHRLRKRCGGSAGNKKKQKQKSEIGKTDVVVEQISELPDIVAGRERGELFGSFLYGLL